MKQEKRQRPTILASRGYVQDVEVVPVRPTSKRLRGTAPCVKCTQGKGSSKRCPVCGWTSKKVKRDSTKPEPLPAGRYGGGLKPEDVDYLVTLYEHRKDRGDLHQNGMTNVTDLQCLTLLQLAGMPARKYVDSMVNDKAANRLNRMFNEYQEDWKFVWQAHAMGMQGERRKMDYKVEDITMIGGQEFADLMEI